MALWVLALTDKSGNQREKTQSPLFFSHGHKKNLQSLKML